MDAPSKLLSDDETVASVVCKAAHTLLGDGWLLWEPESIWKELEHQHIDISEGNRQQLMAGRALLVHGRFFYDGMVFDRTCAAFANEVLDFEGGVDDTLAMHLAWGMDEAQKISALFNDSFLLMDREPCEVAAMQLWEEGFVLAPPELSFAQAALDRRCGQHNKDLKQDVTSLWADLKGASLKDFPFPETAKGVQCARLASVQLFLEEQRGLRSKQLVQL